MPVRDSEPPPSPNFKVVLEYQYKTQFQYKFSAYNLT